MMDCLHPSAFRAEVAFPAALGNLGPEDKRLTGSMPVWRLFLQVPRRGSGSKGNAWQLPGQLHAGRCQGTSSLRHSHRKHTAPSVGS